MASTRRVAYVERLPNTTADLHMPPTRPTQGTRAACAALIRAQNLAAIVRDEGPDSTGTYLDDLDRDELYALVTTLAAMVPIDSTPAELLAWLFKPADQKDTA